MTRWWNDPGVTLAPEDLRRLEAVAAPHPGWEVARDGDATWTAERRPGPGHAEGGARLASESLAGLGGLIAGEERRPLPPDPAPGSRRGGAR
ncbi:hypothetical protein [Bailinhaonella thermotolerans]|uniref:Uncharacterized protein n=1 Tax=Bailinhaonella thermotolerans TaxID=1070861 RepID=A0A3A4B297_9ACTN|nr:hypothetical protein [Bailinhaonella thermotolerans]RJL34288.1 hypothetical protein D5H75_07470 [Bailinhaonella thermotolerans]